VRPLIHFLLIGAVAFAASRFVARPIGHDEAALYQEALRLGLDHRDPVVRRRLVANLRFAGAEPGASDDELLREAFAMRMEKRDVVVRRRLVQAMELRTASHRERRPSTEPATWRFSHVLVHSADAAARVRAELVADDAGPDAAARRSEPFLLGNRFGPATRAEIASTFGADVADAITSLEPGRWSGPIRSAWGVHLVWVEP